MGGEKHGPFQFIAEETCCVCAGVETGQGILPEGRRSRLYLYYAEIDILDRMEINAPDRIYGGETENKRMAREIEGVWHTAPRKWNRKPTRP